MHSQININKLNAYQINIFQSVQIMHKKNIQHIFVKLFGAPCHHKVLLNKFLSTTNIPKNITVSNIE